MQNTTNFNESNARLIDSVTELIAIGNTDPHAYAVFVRIHLNPWLANIQQVAEVIAASELAARAASSSGSGDVLDYLRVGAEQRLSQAVYWRDARAAARAAIFACGVSLAVEARETTRRCDGIQ